MGLVNKYHVKKVCIHRQAPALIQGELHHRNLDGVFFTSPFPGDSVSSFCPLPHGPPASNHTWLGCLANGQPRLMLLEARGNGQVVEEGVPPLPLSHLVPIASNRIWLGYLADGQPDQVQ